MIDRGDLVAETSIYKLPYNQKKIIKEVNLNNKPIIVATEMMHSMIENEKPTKSEVLMLLMQYLMEPHVRCCLEKQLKANIQLNQLMKMVKIHNSSTRQIYNFQKNPKKYYLYKN